MKKIVALVGMLLSGSAFAIENGSQIDWHDYENLVEMNCTGTVIGGQWVLTAAHCSWPASGGLRPVALHSGVMIETLEQVVHPDRISGVSSIDIAVWKLASVPEIKTISFLSDRRVITGERIDILGLGGTEFSKATLKTTPDVVDYRLELKEIGEGNTQPGDSGSPYFDSNGFIVGIHNGSAAKEAEGARISSSKNFILDTINAWHYPTSVKTINGTATISVQSLHRGDVIDTSYSDGDVSLDLIASTCDDASIPEFGICTYVINSNGGEGKLYLTPTESITVNRAPEPAKPEPKPDNGGSGGGGSFGFLSLIGLLGLAWRRKD